MRIVIAITGASGSIYGIRLLELLKDKKDIETHLIISSAGEKVLIQETDYKEIEKVRQLANFFYEVDDIGARISSGTFTTDGVIVAPCSAKTLSSIACSYGDNLITRTCSVALKERRKVIVVFRETPFHMSHIENMGKITTMGGVILPPVPAFYHKPKSIDDLVNHIVGKILDMFHIEHDLFERWGGICKSEVEYV